MHEQRAHKNWYHERQVQEMDVRKARWNAEESSLLARQEARLVREGIKCVNQALLPLFPNRTLEAIKGQRRCPRYREKVRHYLGELDGPEMGDRADPDPQEVPVQTEWEPQPNRLEVLRAAIVDVMSRSDPLVGREFEMGCLDRICRGVPSWSLERIAGQLDIYLQQVYPHQPRKTGDRRVTEEVAPMTKRQARRAEYVRTQRAWKKNPCNCLRIILKDKTVLATPTKEVMEPYWKNVMTQECDRSPGVGPTMAEPRDALWRPIEPAEIKAAFAEMTTAPGPDGLSARQLRAVPMNVLTGVMNLLLLCGRLPRRLLESRTTLIPKKDGASTPGDFRPITVSSVLTRAYHKVLANRLTKSVNFDRRQRAFLPIDGTAESIFDLDMILRYHRQNFKPLYMASIDVAKAFDSVTHNTIRDTLTTKGITSHLVEYIADVYARSTTRLKCDGWESEKVTPRCGVKQGDPLSPIIFNMVMDGLLRLLPPEVGVDIEGERYSALAFADDLVFVASTPQGLQTVLDEAASYLAKCGLAINTGKSFTVAIRSVPHMKKSVVDGRTRFMCAGQELPALKREDEWKYLGVPFTPEGRSRGQETELLKTALQKLTSAPLKPQQRMFAVRVMVLPGLYHLLTLGNTTLSRLKRVDTMVRAAVRRWLDLPHDTPKAYFQASVKDGGLSVPSMRWLMPLHRWRRLKGSRTDTEQLSPYLAQEAGRVKRRLREGGIDICTTANLEMRWARMLHSSMEGRALKESRKVPQQHQWLTEGTRFLSGRDFVNAAKIRINALPTRSRTAKGRVKDRLC